MKLTSVSSLAICLLLTGCNTSFIKDSRSENNLANVSVVDEYLLNIDSASLKFELTKLSQITGLSLDYQAEPLTHKKSGSLVGNAESIAIQLASGLPVNVFRVSNTIVVQKQWFVQPGISLEEQLMKWDSESEWTVVWHSKLDQNIESYAQFNGSFKSVVEQLFKSVRNDGSDITPEFYPNNTVVIR
jgi:hypothetical protein